MLKKLKTRSKFLGRGCLECPTNNKINFLSTKIELVIILIHNSYCLPLNNNCILCVDQPEFQACGTRLSEEVGKL